MSSQLCTLVQHCSLSCPIGPHWYGALSRCLKTSWGEVLRYDEFMTYFSLCLCLEPSNNICSRYNAHRKMTLKPVQMFGCRKLKKIFLL